MALLLLGGGRLFVVQAVVIEVSGSAHGTINRGVYVVCVFSLRSVSNELRRWSSGYDGTLPTSRPEFDSRTAHVL